jgi:predicted Zn-dependent protease
MKLNKEIESILKADLEHLNSTKIGRRALLSSVPFLVVSCATKTRGTRSGSNKGQKTNITIKDEERMANDYMPKMTKDYPIIKNPTFSRYISNVGNQIVIAYKLNSKPYNYEF